MSPTLPTEQMKISNRSLTTSFKFFSMRAANIKLNKKWKQEIKENLILLLLVILAFFFFISGRNYCGQQWRKKLFASPPTDSGFIIATPLPSASLYLSQNTSFWVEPIIRILLLGLFQNSHQKIFPVA